MTDQISLYYNKVRYDKDRPIPLKEIQVDMVKDTNPLKPIPNYHEIKIQNDSEHRIEEISVKTNFPETAINTDVSAIFLVTPTTVTLVKADNAVWTVTSGTASSYNVYITGGVLTLQNTFGSTQDFNYMMLRVY